MCDLILNEKHIIEDDFGAIQMILSISFYFFSHLFFSFSLFFYLNFLSHIYFDTHTQSSYKNQWFVQSFEWLTATNIDDKTTNLWWYIEYIESFIVIIMVGINFYIHHYHHHWHHHLFNLWHGDTIFYEINLNLQ